MHTIWLQAFFDVKFGGEKERGKGDGKNRGGGGEGRNGKGGKVD